MYDAPSTSPGCCTATNTEPSSLSMIGPQVSAPVGTARNCSTLPRSGPSAATRCRASLRPMVPGWPSVEIHRFPAPSKATLSGQEIGETGPV